MFQRVCGTPGTAQRFCLNKSEYQIVFGSLVVENVWKINYYKAVFALVITAD